VQAIDIAPTIAFVLGIPAPADSEGKVLRQITKGSGK
jgi:arylsulfatase A-like enzyme